MRTPIVTIQTGSTLENFFDEIMESLNIRFHARGNQFPVYPVSDAEQALIDSATFYASHASDDEYTIGANHHVYDASGNDLGHIERLMG